MKTLLGITVVLALGAGAGFLSSHRKTGRVQGFHRAVGVDPGNVGKCELPSAPGLAPGDRLVGFSSGCFWGSEEAFRRIPGIVATAVGYTGGSSQFPTYEVAHRTGHLETVLVEFNPKRTPFTDLLKVYWTLPRSTSDAPVPPTSSYKAAIWTYDQDEAKAAATSRDAVEKKLHHPTRVAIQPAQPFYMAEDYHQQYDEKAGKELCNTQHAPKR
jgi:peptide-methionine (S)-S-oxide reductase